MVKHMAAKGWVSFKVRLKVVLCRVPVWGSLWSPLRGLSVGRGRVLRVDWGTFYMHLEAIAGIVWAAAGDGD